MLEKVEFTNMCMIEDKQNEKVVVMMRNKNDWPGITFPGGHVEKGESFVDAVIREVKEETGLTINSPELCGIKDWFEDNRRYVVLLYKTNKFSGTLKSSEEGKVWWESTSNLHKLDLSVDFLDLLKVFIDDELSEFFYRLVDNNWNIELK